MATSKLVACSLMLLSASVTAAAREAASPAACRSAASSPQIADAKSAADQNPADLQAVFKLADAWSDAGCFNDSLQVLQQAQGSHAASRELATRVRVARSLVGEEHFFDDLDRADDAAKMKRDMFRCTTLADLESCNEAARLAPEDGHVLIAQADALMRARRPVEAVPPLRRAALLSPNETEVAEKLRQAELQAAAVAPPAGAKAGVSMASSTPPASPAAARSPAAGSPQNAAGVAHSGAKRPRSYSNVESEDQTH